MNFFTKIKNFFLTIAGLYPQWLRNMSGTMQAIIVLIVLSVLGGVGYYVYSNIREYFWYILIAMFVVIVVYLFTQSPTGKKMGKWLLNSWRDTKLLTILVSIFLFQFLYPIGNEYISRAVDVFFVFSVVAIVITLFKYKPFWVKILKYIIALALLFLGRAYLHTYVTNGVEQFLNPASIVAIIIISIMLIYDVIFAKDKETKRFLLVASAIIAFVTIVFSHTITAKFAAEKRMSSIRFIPIEVQPDTVKEMPISNELADILFFQDNDADEGASKSDFILFEGKPALITDITDIHWSSLWNPFNHTKTKFVKTLTMDENWMIKIEPYDNHAIYSSLKKLGDNTASAASKKLGFVDYMSDSFYSDYKIKDNNGTFYSVILESTLSGFWNPVKFPKGVRLIKDDENQTYNFLFGTGDFVSLKDAVKKYPFLKNQPLISIDIVRKMAKSVEYVKGFGNVLFQKGLIVPDRDINGNIIVEQLYTTINGYYGQYAKVEFVAKNAKGNKHINDKKTSVKRRGIKVSKTWYVPLFYTGVSGDTMKVFVYDNEDHHTGYKSKSNYVDDFKLELYSNGYDVTSMTTINRDNNVFLIAALVKTSDSGVYSDAVTILLKPLSKAGNAIKVTSKTDMEKKIKELSH